ncbi:MAG: acyl-CoA/acyl-ACP dehydrogenase [Proteobacteria bacterium]|nr:acyl-CoA/acyl-ACP dehydrogenase [Pseudomonadota bacterium]
MRAAFTEDQIMLRDTVRDTLAAECTPAAVRASWEQPSAFWPLLAEQGVLALTASEELGGLGMGALDWVLVLEEAGRVALPEPLIEHIAAVELLAESGEAEWVERLASGEARVTVFQSGGYAVSADTADAVIRLGDTGAELLTEFTTVRHAAADGSRPLFTVDGAGAPLSGDADAALDRAILATAAQLLGLGNQVLDLAVEYSKARRQFGKPIGSFQAVQHHLVDALLKLKFAAPVVHRAAHSVATNDPQRALHVSMAKIYASEAASLACRKSLQVHGAIGYTFEYDLHLWMKRVWALSEAWGNPAWHRNRAASSLFGA